MKVGKLQDILKLVAPNTEIFFTNPARPAEYLSVLSTNLEYAADGSVSVSFVFAEED